MICRENALCGTRMVARQGLPGVIWEIWRSREHLDLSLEDPTLPRNGGMIMELRLLGSFGVRLTQGLEEE